MSMQNDLLRIALAGFGDIQEWRLADADRARELGYPRRVDTPLIDDWATVFVDLTLDVRDGSPVCHEVNGSNAVGSDALLGDSGRRARGEVQAALQRARELGFLSTAGALSEPVVTVHAHQHWRWFRTGGEFYPRVGAFATALGQALPGSEPRIRGAGDVPGEEPVTVLVGDVPSMAACLTHDEALGCLRYAGRPVIFVGNPNLLTELSRTGRLPPYLQLLEKPVLRQLHGSRLFPAIQDKGLQQRFFEDTVVRPLRQFSADSREEALALARQELERGPLVMKPTGTSGGAGVQVLTPAMSEDELERRMDAVIGECAAKYGDDVESMIFPLRGFEFARSTGCPMEDGDHLWDLRIGLDIEPGVIHGYPVSFRLTPTPFDPDRFHDDRDQWVSNVSGREETLLRAGTDAVTLDAVGVSDELLGSMVEACVRWVLRAWDAGTKGEGRHPTFEDACEALDPNFYPRDKFRTGVTPP